MMRRSALFFALLLAVNSSAALAECSLAEFGHHPQPPSPIRPHPVDNTYAQFSYGSDVWTNPQTGSYEAWNFIKNEDTQKTLNVDWPKAGIHYNIGSSLQPSQLVCNYNSLAEPSDNPDFTKYIDKDAPITYSSNPQDQKAWIYAEPTDEGGARPTNSDDGKKTEGWLKHIFSRFVTAVNLDDDTRHDIDISIGSAYSHDKLQIHLETGTQNLTVGIAKLSEFLGDDNFELAQNQFKDQGYLVRTAPAYEAMGYDVARRLLGEENVKSTVLLLRGQNGGTVAFPIAADAKIIRQSSVIVIFDKDNHPIAADAILLYKLTLQ